jgi:hypothetical protein
MAALYRDRVPESSFSRRPLGYRSRVASESREPGSGGYPEENPADLDPSTAEGTGEGSDLDQEPRVRESDAEEEPGSSTGASGEGTQSTGHPDNAG